MADRISKIAVSKGARLEKIKTIQHVPSENYVRVDLVALGGFSLDSKINRNCTDAALWFDAIFEQSTAKNADICFYCKTVDSYGNENERLWLVVSLGREEEGKVIWKNVIARNFLQQHGKIVEKFSLEM